MDKVEHFLDNQIDGTSYFFYCALPHLDSSELQVLNFQCLDAGHTAQQPSEGDEEEDRKSECKSDFCVSAGVW
jgi:hypothetical protein